MYVLRGASERIFEFSGMCFTWRSYTRFYFQQFASHFVLYLLVSFLLPCLRSMQSLTFTRNVSSFSTKSFDTAICIASPSRIAFVAVLLTFMTFCLLLCVFVCVSVLFSISLRLVHFFFNSVELTLALVCQREKPQASQIYSVFVFPSGFFIFIFSILGGETRKSCFEIRYEKLYFAHSPRICRTYAMWHGYTLCVEN